jgi:hypothetical protein
MPILEALLLFKTASWPPAALAHRVAAGRSRFPIAAFTGALLCVLIAPATHASPNVTRIGDDYRGVVMREVAAKERSAIHRRDGVYELVIESAGLTVSSLAPGGGITAMANLLRVTDIALIVVDATVGPTHTIREHVLIARQARVPMLAMLLGRVAQLYADAPGEADEVLAIEAQEIRELLSGYDLNGNAAGVYYDARTPKTVAGISAFGNRESLRALSRFAPRRAREAVMGQVSDIWGAVYLLTESEADGDAVSLAPNDTFIIWSEGTQSTATLRSVSQYHPGDYREMPLTLEAPIKGVEGSRILLVRGGRVVGLGAITQIRQ